MADPGRKPAGSPTKQDLIQLVVDLKATGTPQATIINKITEQGFSATYAYEVLRDAKPFVAEVLKDVFLDTLNDTIAEMEVQYVKCLEAGEKATALSFRKEINKLKGFEKASLDITSKGDKIENISVIKLMPSIRPAEENDNI